MNLQMLTTVYDKISKSRWPLTSVFCIIIMANALTDSLEYSGPKY